MKQKLVRALPILGIALPIVLLSADPAFAQTRQNFLDLQLPIFFRGGGGNGFFDVLRTIIQFVLFLGGLLAFFYVLYGGFVYLTSGGDAGKAATGTKMIVNAIIGIIIIFLSYSLVNFMANRINIGGSGVDTSVY